MVMTLVVLTFVVFIALDYFVFSRQRAEAASPALVLGALPAARRVIPVGISLQPTFTWSRFGPAGEAYVGVHPMLVGLIGGACEFELLDAGQHVGRGEPLVRLAQGGRRLTVRSPIAGQVVKRESLLNAVWGDDVLVVDRTIDVHIRKIREKLGRYADYIETIKGVGYRLREQS